MYMKLNFQCSDTVLLEQAHLFFFFFFFFFLILSPAAFMQECQNWVLTTETTAVKGQNIYFLAYYRKIYQPVALRKEYE